MDTIWPDWFILPLLLIILVQLLFCNTALFPKLSVEIKY